MKSKPAGQSLDPGLLKILVCPKCKGKLAYSPEVSVLDCANCRLRYRINDGIPVMLPEEAEKY